MKFSSSLYKIAKELAVIGDQDNNRINILCQPYSLYPNYITNKLNQNQWLLIKFKPKKIAYKWQYEEFCYDLIRMQGNYTIAVKSLFQWQKTVNVQQLKQQLLYGQFNLDASTFEQLYQCRIDNFVYRDFSIYILSDKFNQNDIKKFIDQIYNVIPNNILKQFGKNIQFKQKLDYNNIAQVDSGILEITEYNIHAFIHQIGHEIYSSLNNTILTIICQNFHNTNNFPSKLSQEDLNEYFAQLFAFYWLNKSKLTIEQTEIIEQYILNKKIRRARIKLIKIGNMHPFYNEIIDSKRSELSKKLIKFRGTNESK